MIELRRWSTLAAMLAALWGWPASATESAPSDVGVDEKLGQTVPGDIVLVDEEGRRVQLATLLDRPTVLSLNYFRCAGLCTPQLNGVVEVLRKVDLSPGRDFQVLTVSFDPRDNPELAGHKRASYLKQLPSGFPASAWRFLTGDPVATRRLADAVGFKFRQVGQDFLHPGVLMVLAPGGRITRYMLGITYLPFDLKMAVVEASAGRTGPTISKLLKFCYSYDPAGRTYYFDIVRLAGVLTMALALGFAVVVAARRRHRREGQTEEGT